MTIGTGGRVGISTVGQLTCHLLECHQSSLFATCEFEILSDNRW